MKILWGLISCFLLIGITQPVAAYTGKGTRKEPYAIKNEKDMREVLSSRAEDSWVYVAVDNHIVLESSITVKKGKFRIFARGADRTIWRSRSLNTKINREQNPQYCIRQEEGTQLVFGYLGSGYQLILDGSKDYFSNKTKTSGWFQLSENTMLTLDKNCHLQNVKNNRYEEFGAAVRSKGKVIVNGEISRCEGDNGGAIKQQGGTLIIEQNAKIHHCISKSEGGGVHVSNGASLMMKGGIVSECYAKEEGGGIFVSENATAEITAGKIMNNSAGESAGGVFSGYGAKLVIGNGQGNGPQIFLNSAKGSGGGIRCNGGINEYAGGTTYLYGGEIFKNHSGKHGGGIACGEPGDYGKSKIIIKNMNIAENTAEDTGGGLWLAKEACGIDGKNIRIENSIISFNQSGKSGGGILLRCACDLYSNYISNNKSSNQGGGVFVHNRGVMILHSGMISANTAKKGSAVFLQGKLQLLENGFVEQNNEVYLSRNTWIELLGKLNRQSTVAKIESASTANGTVLVKSGYKGADAENDLYISGDSKKEYFDDFVKKRYEYCGAKNKCLRASTEVKGIEKNCIIISEKYTIKYFKNTDKKVENFPRVQRKFWNEDITIQSENLLCEGYVINSEKHWNTKKNGEGIQFVPGSVFFYDRNQSLYAQWKSLGIKRNRKIRFISMQYLYTLSLNSKWQHRLKRKLTESLTGNTAKYHIELSYEKISAIKKKAASEKGTVK